MGKLEDDILYREIFMSNKSSGGGGGITPTGTKEINITTNGDTTVDVAEYKYAHILANVQSDDTLYKLIRRTITTYSDDSLTSVGTYAFAGCLLLTSINLPNVNDLSKYSFAYCKALTNVDFPNVVNVNSYLFENCENLVSVNMPKCRYIAAYMYNHCYKLETIIGTELATTVSSYAFAHCYALKSINLPNITDIQSFAFMYCKALQYLELPKLEAIGKNTFYNCTSLQYIKIGTQDSTEVATASSSPNIPSQTKVYVPDALVDSYKTATNWSNYASQIYPLSEFTE